MTAQLMDELLINDQEYRVASQIQLPKRRSKRWRHITKVPHSEWQPLFRSTLCWRNYAAVWEITDNKLFLKYLDGCYQLKANEPLWAEWVTTTIRLITTESWFCTFDSEFENEFVLQVVNGVAVNVSTFS